MLFTNFITSALTTVVFGVILAQAKDLAPGRYRIFNGDSAARSYLGDPNYPAPINIIYPNGDNYEKWDIKRDGNGAYSIRNVGSGATTYADQALNAQVLTALGRETKWFIEDKGSGAPGEPGSYVIKIPFQDYVWTKTSRAHSAPYVTLKGSDGSQQQRWAFKPVH